MQAVRQRLGVVFQAPSLDKKLTVAENLMHQGHLYGLSGRRLHERQDEMLGRLALTDRRGDMVEKLSGGLRRRVELAKGMLHRPRLLLWTSRAPGSIPAPQRSVGLFAANPPRRRRDGRAHHASAGRSRQGRSDRDPERRLAGGARHARGIAGHGRRRFDHDSNRRSGGAGPRRSKRGSAARRGVGLVRRARCGWSSPTGISGSPGWSRRFPARFKRSRWASRRWKTCSSSAPGIASGTEREEVGVG